MTPMLPFRIPHYVSQAEEDVRSAFEVSVVGLCSDQISRVVLDRRIAAEQVHPTYDVALLPLNSGDALSLEEASFYADYLGYIHDCPALLVPREGQFLGVGASFRAAPNSSGDEAVEWELYIQAWKAALEALGHLRLGSLACVLSPLQWDGGLQHVRPRGEYETAAQGLHLYSSALRQLDVASEYTQYYRVLEWVSNNRPSSWLHGWLPQLEAHRLGELRLSHALEGDEDSIDLFAEVRQRAVSYYSEFSSEAKCAERLERLRNQMVHGVRIVDSSKLTSLAEVHEANALAKVLARMAIESRRAVQAGPQTQCCG